MLSNCKWHKKWLETIVNDSYWWVEEEDNDESEQFVIECLFSYEIEKYLYKTNI